MSSDDELQLGLAAGVGGDTGPVDVRVAKLHGAVDRLNTMAKKLRDIAADVDWSGDAAELARSSFATLAGTMNEHADAINAIAAADASTGDPLGTAHRDYQSVQSVVDQPGGHYYGQGAGESVADFRARLATEAREKLDVAMRAARAQVVAAASWDLEPRPATGGVTGTVPPGSSSPPDPGGFDPTGPVVGTVPPGSSSPSDDGGFDPTGPVGGTVPPGSSTPAPQNPPAQNPSAQNPSSQDDGGFDPTGPVAGTVPDDLVRRLG